MCSGVITEWILERYWQIEIEYLERTVGSGTTAVASSLHNVKGDGREWDGLISDVLALSFVGYCFRGRFTEWGTSVAVVSRMEGVLLQRDGSNRRSRY